MDFEEYQKESRKTAKYPKIGKNFVYPTLGIVGEAGEVAEKVKKIFRDDNKKLTEKRKDEIIKELGDLLWYMAQVATELDVSLESIAKDNLKKLKSRLKRDKIHGDGDNR